MVPLLLSCVASQQHPTVAIFHSFTIPQDSSLLWFSSYLAAFSSQSLLLVGPSGVPRTTLVPSCLYLYILMGGLLLLLGFNTTYGPTHDSQTSTFRLTPR